MKPIRIAVVGCGGMARFYCRRYTQVKNAELALLIDTNEDVVKKMAQDFGNVKWSTEFKDCLAPDIDMVDISTPNFLHADQAVAAIKAGKHVIIQKPLAPSVDEAERILAAASATDKNVGMYMSMFNDPMMLDLKNVIQNGHMGAVVSVHCRNAHRGGLTVPAGTWRGDLKKCGGGSFIQLAIHNIDAVQWLVGSRINSVMAYSHNTLCSNIGGDDATTACCMFENGILGTLESSYAADRSVLAVYGTKGHFVLGGDNCLEIQLDEPFTGEVLYYSEKGAIVRYPMKDTLELYNIDNPYDQSVAFVQAILAGKEAPVSLETGLHDLKVVKAVYQSAVSGAREPI